jgi:hypothetical protein
VVRVGKRRMASIAMVQISSAVGDILQRTASEVRGEDYGRVRQIVAVAAATQNASMEDRKDAARLSSNIHCGEREKLMETTAIMAPLWLKETECAAASLMTREILRHGG